MSVTLERRCENCERRLGPSRVDRRFCSTACRVAAHRARLSADEPTSWRSAAAWLEANAPERWAPSTSTRGGSDDEWR